MPAFQTSVDIGNRALQQCGAKRMTSFTDGSVNASEVSFCYDKLREAELQRRNWTFAIKEVFLRAIDSNAMTLSASLWAPTTTYFRGSIVADENGNLWISTIADNINNDPLLTNFWEPYYGPLSVPLYDSSGTTAYNAGELVYTAPGDGTNKVYLSLISANSDVPATATAWSSTATYFKDQVVTFSNVAYMSLVDLNIGNEPDISPTQWTTSFTGGSGSVNWLEIGGSDFPAGVALVYNPPQYPVGSGPVQQTWSKNAYRLPAGYLRRAPRNPKTGTTWGGGPSGEMYDDWVIENKYLTSIDPGPIRLRFVADFTDVKRMHALFCEGLSARIAYEVAPKVTQSPPKRAEILQAYNRWMGEARQVNAIEQGWIDPPDDDLITTRY